MNSMTARTWSAFAAVACFCVACGDDGANAGPTIGELPTLYAQHLCPEVEACLDATSLRSVFGPEGCEPYLIAQVEDSNLPAVQAAVDQGRVRYAASKVQPCFDELVGIGCDFATSRAFDRKTCDQVFVGTIEIGAACDVDEECIGEAFCKRAKTCPGACHALLGPGAACEKDDQCEEGLTCSGSTNTCSANVLVGKPCGGTLAGDCAPGLACIGADEMTGAAGTCTEQSELFTGALGDRCDFDTGMLCKDGLSCIVESVAPGGATSLVCAEHVASKGACKFGAPSQCPAEEYCDADIKAGEIAGNCLPLPKVGERCVSLAASPPCASGLRCDTDMLCHPLARLGQACVSDLGCASKRCAKDVCQRPEVCKL